MSRFIRSKKVIDIEYRIIPLYLEWNCFFSVRHIFNPRKKIKRFSVYIQKKLNTESLDLYLILERRVSVQSDYNTIFQFHNSISLGHRPWTGLQVSITLKATGMLSEIDTRRRVLRNQYFMLWKRRRSLSFRWINEDSCLCSWLRNLNGHHSRGTSLSLSQS